MFHWGFFYFRPVGYTELKTDNCPTGFLFSYGTFHQATTTVPNAGQPSKNACGTFLQETFTVPNAGRPSKNAYGTILQETSTVPNAGRPQRKLVELFFKKPPPCPTQSVLPVAIHYPKGRFSSLSLNKTKNCCTPPLLQRRRGECSSFQYHNIKANEKRITLRCF